jgi:hypothetical protein
MFCELCKQDTVCISSLLNGVYYKDICRSCLSSGYGDSAPTSGAASFDRRRGYEDYADETIQPYTASGPNPEFARLYPRAAEKVYDKDTLEKIKSKL